MKSAHRRSALFLFLAVIFIRLPFFFRDYIDHDESTFILMGASVADGFLPYEHLWDLKSPFLFYVFGLIEYLFPDSLIAIRLFGALVIFGSALLLMAIARRVEIRNGFWIALGYVILSSLFGSLQGVMSEHLAVLFILAGIYFFIGMPGATNAFIGSMFLGLALLCKLNYAYAIVLFMAFQLNLQVKQNGIAKSLVWAFSSGAGIILPFMVIAIPFLVVGKWQLYFDSTFLAPFAYGHSSGLSFLQKMGKTWWIIAAGLAVCIFALKASTDKRNFTIGICLLLVGTIFSFFTSGKVNGHYLIEVYPFFLLLVVGILTRKYFRISLPMATLIVLLVSFESWKEYALVFRQLRSESTPYNGKSLLVIKELKSRGLEKKKIFFGDYHVGYWFLDQYPLSKSTTHPSNLARPFLFKYFGNKRNSSLEELTYILEETKPEVVVSRKPFISFLPPEGAENKYFQKVMAESFTPVVQQPEKGIFIWLRK